MISSTHESQARKNPCGGFHSRVVLEINGKRLHLHRPHPGKEAKRYQVEELRDLLDSEGLKP
jgi:hypothetical protein